MTPAEERQQWDDAVADGRRMLARPSEGTSATVLAPWVVDIQRAVRSNLLDRHIRQTPPDVLSSEFCADIPYAFHGQRHHIAPMLVCDVRRYGACADVAAAVIASAVSQGLTAHLCVEAPAHLGHYTHVRVIVEGMGRPVSLDGYARWRPSGLRESCEWIVPASSLVDRGPITLYRPTERT